jgi:hypothetical protein
MLEHQQETTVTNQSHGISRMEQVPGPRAEGDEFFLLPVLGFRGVAGFAKGPRARVLSAQGRSSHVALVLVSASSPATAATVQIGVWGVGLRAVLARHGRRRRWGLVATVVNDARQEIFTTARKSLNSFLGGLVLSGAGRQRRLLVVVRCESGRRERRLMVGMRRGTRAVGVHATARSEWLREDIRNGWQSVAGLLCWNVVDVRCL